MYSLAFRSSLSGSFKRSALQVLSSSGFLGKASVVPMRTAQDSSILGFWLDVFLVFMSIFHTQKFPSWQLEKISTSNFLLRVSREILRCSHENSPRFLHFLGFGCIPQVFTSTLHTLNFAFRQVFCITSSLFFLKFSGIFLRLSCCITKFPYFWFCCGFSSVSTSKDSEAHTEGFGQQTWERETTRKTILRSPKISFIHWAQTAIGTWWPRPHKGFKDTWLRQHKNSKSAMHLLCLPSVLCLLQRN